MLPKILEVAEKNGLVIEPRSYGKKETMAQCPFCASNDGKYKLSLNTVDNVYKCWSCKESGGVLHFEAKLTGLSYQEIKEKYFKGKKKSVNLAEILTSKQMEKIGLSKRSDKKEIAQKWFIYEFHQLSEMFAELLIINQKEVDREKYFLYLQERAKESKIPQAFDKLMMELVNYPSVHSNWAKSGITVANIAYSQAANDCLKTIPLVHMLFMKEKERMALIKK